MKQIRTTRQFKNGVDAAFETMKTRDEAKACYDFARDEYRAAEEELCRYAAANPEVFEGTDGTSGWGQTDSVEYTMSSGSTVERADGGRLELNKAKIKADGLDGDDLMKLGLVRVATMSMKLKCKAA